MSTAIMPASALQGDKVVNAKGHVLGRIADLVLDLPAGEIVYAILALEDAPGANPKRVLVRWNQLQVDMDIKRIVLDMTRRQLESAPVCDPPEQTEASDRTRPSPEGEFFADRAVQA